MSVLISNPAHHRAACREPYARGQSGMERPASFEVTRAPAISRRNVQQPEAACKLYA